MELYIHIPFCRQKCGYCAFYSEASNRLITPYLDKIERELNSIEPTSEISSVYFGGGTPTLLHENELQRLFNMVKKLPLKSDTEISIEANPETLSASKLELIRNFANRLSIGVQSFNSALRDTLGRKCSQQALDEALTMAKKLNFPHLNCDLIYAIPHQTKTLWQQDLEQAVATGADHISCYSLTLEEGTKLVKDGVVGIDEDFSAEMWNFTGEFLAQYGIERYEISNYAKPTGRCQHNLAVWGGAELYGFGPAAASYDGKVRKTELPDINLWLNDAPPELDELSPQARRREIAVVQLRTTIGWQRQEYLALKGATEEEWEQLLIEANKLPKNLIDTTYDRLRLTTKGLLFWDYVATELL